MCARWEPSPLPRLLDSLPEVDRLLLEVDSVTCAGRHVGLNPGLQLGLGLTRPLGERRVFLLSELSKLGQADLLRTRLLRRWVLAFLKYPPPPGSTGVPELPALHDPWRRGC